VHIKEAPAREIRVLWEGETVRHDYLNPRRSGGPATAANKSQIPTTHLFSTSSFLHRLFEVGIGGRRVRRTIQRWSTIIACTLAI
jgi:hypothetical protein